MSKSDGGVDWSQIIRRKNRKLSRFMIISKIRIKYNVRTKIDYGTFGLWGAILAGGETVVSKRTFRFASL